MNYRKMGLHKGLSFQRIHPHLPYTAVGETGTQAGRAVTGCSPQTRSVLIINPFWTAPFLRRA